LLSPYARAKTFATRCCNACAPPGGGFTAGSWPLWRSTSPPQQRVPDGCLQSLCWRSTPLRLPQILCKLLLRSAASQPSCCNGTPSLTCAEGSAPLSLSGCLPSPDTACFTPLLPGSPLLSLGQALQQAARSGHEMSARHVVRPVPGSRDRQAHPLNLCNSTSTI